MLQRKSDNNQDLIEGHNTNYSVVIGGITIFLSSMTIGFAIYWTPTWIIISVGLLLLSFFHLTSKFRITLTANSIAVEKRTYGLRFFNLNFSFDKVSIEGKDIQFVNGNKCLNFYFERKSFDTVEFEIDLKYRNIGNAKNSVELMKTLREMIIKTQ